MSIERLSPNRSDNLNHDEIGSNSSELDDAYSSSDLRKDRTKGARSEGALEVEGTAQKGK